MARTEQQYGAVTFSGDLVRAIGQSLQEWSQIDDQLILEAYRANGSQRDPAYPTQEPDEFILSIERGEPEQIRAEVMEYTIKGRTRTNDPFTDDRYMSIDDLATWIDTQRPDQVYAKISTTRPLAIDVHLRGGSWGGTVNAVDGTMAYGFYVLGYEPTVTIESALDRIAEAIAPFIPDPPPTQPPTTQKSNQVFLGHGGQGDDWRILEERIKEAGYEVKAFETSVSSGQVSIQVVERAIRGSFAAVMYMSPADRMADGSMRARQNVVHEIGYSQGVLGLQNVVVVQNEDTEMFSNMAGVAVVRFRSNDLYSKLDTIIAEIHGIRARSLK